MNVLSFFSKKKQDSKIYLGLFLKEQEAIGFVFQVSHNTLSVIAQKSTTYSNGWENVLEDIDQLLLELDKDSKLGLHEVIFFVYSYFINDVTKEIVQPYKDIIKSIIKNLDLKALGYIECYEAIAAYLQNKEGSPLNAVLVEFDKTNFGVFVYKGGKRVFAQNTARTDSFSEDFEALLRKAREMTMLPSRLILYDSANIDKEVEQIRSKQWDTSLFVQLPRVEIIKEEDLHQGLSDIFMLQLHNQLPAVEEEPLPGSLPADSTNDDTVVLSVPAAAAVAPAEVMGFTIGHDVPDADIVDEYEPETEATENAIESSQVTTTAKKSPFAFMSGFKNKFKLSGPLSKRRFINFLWIPGVLVILLALFSIEFFFHKSTITVYFPSQNLNKSVDITANLNSDQGGFVVKESTYEANFNDTKSTTGQKQVGDKAKGGVTIHNFDDTERVISKGTTISSGTFSFTTDQDVKVASATEALVGGDFVKQPGKVGVTVTAADIGPDYNLDKGKRFKVGDLSSSLYFGVNDNAFSGGTKKNIQTVAKKDMDDLKLSIINKAKKESTDTVSSKLPTNQKLLNELTDSEISDVQFSKEIGEEANDLTLQAGVVTTYYYYNPDQFKTAIADQFKGELESGFALDKSKITYTVSDVKKTDDTISLSLAAVGHAMKEISKEDVLNQITGKSKDDLNKILKIDVNAVAYTVNISSPLFFLDGRMPFLKKNIDLKIATQ